MVTAVQARRFLQPLVQKNPDLELVGRLVVVKPVRHVLRAVLLGRRSTAEIIEPSWFAYPLFEPYASYGLSFGEPDWRVNWKTTDTNISQVMCQEIERRALPPLRRVVTMADYVDLIPSMFCAHQLLRDEAGLFASPRIRLLIDLAMGDIDSAKELCRKQLCNRQPPDSEATEETKANYNGSKILFALLEKDDIKGLVDTLHAWEAANVKTLKIDHLWARTPFPIEEKYGLV